MIAAEIGLCARVTVATWERRSHLSNMIWQLFGVDMSVSFLCPLRLSFGFGFGFVSFFSGVSRCLL